LVSGELRRLIKIKAIPVALIIILLSTGLLMDVAYPGTTAAASGIDTRTAPDGAGASTSEFPLGATVYVYLANDTSSNGTGNITVYGPDGTIVTQSLNQTVSASGEPSISFAVTQDGYYDIDFNDQGNQVTSRVVGVSVLVLPESALGTIMVVLACAGAVGVYKIKTGKVKNPKP
jgi:hypothetical protein